MMRKIKTLYSRTLLLRAMACGLILTVHPKILVETEIK